jgi:hypothetical protein
MRNLECWGEKKPVLTPALSSKERERLFLRRAKVWALYLGWFWGSRRGKAPFGADAMETKLPRPVGRAYSPHSFIAAPILGFQPRLI